jgi:N-acetylmuramoyl-L-alanine amidase/S-layer homology domain/Rhamnogalacturonan I lyases beta-sheet domain
MSNVQQAGSRASELESMRVRRLDPVRRPRLVSRFSIHFLPALVLGALALFFAASPNTAYAGPASTETPAETRAQTATIGITDVATVAFEQPAEHVAAYWQGAENAYVTLAFSTDGVHFGDPVDAGRDDAEKDPTGMTYGAVLVADGAIAVRVTTDTPLAQLNVIGMSSAEGPGVALSSPAMAAAVEPGQPSVITRAEWGANPSYLNWAPQFYPAKKVIVHHTATNMVASGTQQYYASEVRSIYYYHAVTRDWGDIAYNFLIDPLGNIYEGRYSDNDADSPAGEDIYGNNVRGGHTYNYNTGTVGIAVLGTYSKVDISPAARAALEGLIAWVAERDGIDPVGSDPYYSPFSAGSTIQTWNIAGHRDYGSTDCPGQAFYNTLPMIRQDVFDFIGPVSAPTPSPTYLRIAMSPDSPVVGQAVALSATLMEESSRRALAGQTVSFATGGIATAQTPLGSAKTDGNGVATVQMTFAAVGKRWVTAEFAPGPNPPNRGSTTSAEVNVAPAGLAAVPGNAKVQLSWNAAPEASSYNVYRNGVKVKSGPIASAGYLDTGLTNGVAYSYQVTAVVNGRESGKSPAVVVTPGVHSFLDVTAGHPYYAAIRGLADAGVVDGKTDGKFHPDDPVTRQQFAKVIVLGSGYGVSESDVCLFKDVSKSGVSSLYPDNYVAVCAAHGITVGKTATTFEPYSNITRAQVASMVVRAAQDSKPSAVVEPRAGWEGVLPTNDRYHGRNIARAEYNGLLAGIDLTTFSVTGKATRGEIAQIIWNLRQK